MTPRKAAQQIIEAQEKAAKEEWKLIPEIDGQDKEKFRDWVRTYISQYHARKLQ